MFKILFFAAIAAVIYFGWRSVRMKQMELESSRKIVRNITLVEVCNFIDQVSPGFPGGAPLQQ